MTLKIFPASSEDRYQASTAGLTTAKILCTMFAFAVLFGCSTAEITDNQGEQHNEAALDENTRVDFSAEVARESVSLDSSQVEKITVPNMDYLVNTGDVLLLNINGEPGFEAMNVRVDAEGYIQLPIIESAQVSGKSLRSIQDKLKRIYSKDFKSPWVLVSISEYRSQPLYFLGEFNSPGVIYMQGPTNLLQGLGLAGGMTPESYLSGARLLRDEKIVPVDVKSLLRDGVMAQNIWLQPKDVFYVPGYQDLNVYVLGAVNLPGAQSYRETTTLLSALAQSEGVRTSRGLLSDTRIIRTNSAIAGELITIDAASILDGTRPDYRLQPGDIVYVPNSRIGNWNEVIEQIAPTVELISGALEPFVQIKYLDNN